MSSGPREVRAARGTELRCRGWRQEAILRLLENNLENAERPEELVVYAALAKAARDWESYDRTVGALRNLADGETLVMQSGKPIGKFRTHSMAPAVVMANGNLVGRFSTPEHFYELEEKGLLIWGGLTAGAWQYIGAQGVIQGTYETFAAVARTHFGGTLAGKLVVTGGLGGMGAAQPLAISRMLGGACIVCEVDGEKTRQRLGEGRIDRIAEDLDQALAWAREAAERREPLAVGLVANAAEVLAELVQRSFTPDVVTDLTSAHDARYGYAPTGMGSREMDELRDSDPERLEGRAQDTMVEHVRAMVELQRRGAVVFDYGNNIRPQAYERGLAEAFEIGIFTELYLRLLFCRGIGPFRWVAVSGETADLDAVDEMVLEEFAGEERITRWIELAREHVPHQGLPARIAWLGHGERSRLALRVNRAVADGTLAGPVAFTRDHMDAGGMTHPYIITENMRDGSDAVADWPLLDAMLNCSAMADLVAIHSGGGGYAGYSTSAGVTVVADGSEAAATRLERTLNADTGLGVLRYADAGYPEAQDAARENGLGLTDGEVEE